MNVLQSVLGGLTSLNDKMNTLRQSKAVQTINQFINSKYMLFVVAILTLLANILGIEFWVYLTLGIVCLYVCLFGKDTLFFACIPLFMYLTPSIQNNPYINSNSFFYPQNGLWFVIAFMVLIVVCYLFRIALDWGFAKFIKTERKLLFGILALGVVFVLGGLGYQEYTFRNLPYALVLFIAFFLLYFMLTATVNWKEVPREYFVWLGLIVGFTVAIQLVNVYIVHFDRIFIADTEARALFDSGKYIQFVISIVTTKIPRNYIYTGWGSYTSMAGVMTTCMPCAFYLASKRKFGVVFHLLGGLLYGFILLSNCRGAIMAGAIIYVVCAIPTLYSKKNRIANIVVYSVVLVCLAVGCIIVRDKLHVLIEKLVSGFEGRMNIFTDGLKRFQDNPVFGQGFFACVIAGQPVGSLFEDMFMPQFWHNTVIQMLAACGIVGLVVYIIHRAQTVVMVIQKPNAAKTYIALAILTLLLICMLDCHIFNIGITLYYSVFLAFMEKSDEQELEQENDFFAALLKKEGQTELKLKENLEN